ncbi:hypothetical protein CDEST_11333 [Colletotrichum destructivum]|uniref:Secreted protein n=1 Tax=Colletotrichum destructivum TaxID=34406 RepID=A0AAX4ISU2_9PEZI|nr:hypothetical protein CDEST_11333 [Colletotrichum destructivum]
MREDLSRNPGALSFVVWPRAWACVACFYLVPKQLEEGEGQQVAADLVGPGCNTPHTQLRMLRHIVYLLAKKHHRRRPTQTPTFWAAARRGERGRHRGRGRDREG